MTAMLSPHRRDAILLALSRFRVLRNMTALSTMRLLGLMVAAHPVVPLGLLGLLGLQTAVVCSPTVGPQATQAQGAPRSPFGVARPGILEKTLRPGWGGTCLSHSVGDEWRTPPTAHINVLELDAEIGRASCRERVCQYV